MSDRLRSILCELEITQMGAAEFCKERGIYSPTYAGRKKRDGCALCYNAKEEERREWFHDYPEAVPIVIELQNIVKEQAPERVPLRGYKYFIE